MLQSKKTGILALLVLLEILFIAYLLLIKTHQKPITELTKSSEREVVLYCIDAAEWDVINPLIAQGKLPNFKKMKNEGSYGYLESLVALSPVSWTEIATGKTKEKHGIYDFVVTSEGNRLVTSNDVKSKRIWNILSGYNKTVSVFWWLVTWPPEVVNGFMISGGFIQGDKRSYPENFRDMFRSFSGTLTDFLNYLHDKYGVAFYAMGTQSVYETEYRFWKYWEPEKFNITDKEEIESGRESISAAYGEYDELFGDLMNNSKNITIFLVSDHGLKAFGGCNFLYRTSELLNKLNISNRIWENPKVPVLNDMRGIINVSLIFRKEVDVEEREGIVEILSNIHYLSDGKNYFMEIQPEYIDPENTLTVRINISSPNFPDFKTGNLSIMLRLSNGEIFEQDIYEYCAGHPPGTPGVIIARGSGIKEGYEITNASTLDITPTILYLYDIPIPEDIDGRVLTEMIREDYLKDHPIRYSNESSQRGNIDKELPDTDEEMTRKILENLRKLGYAV